MSITKTYLDRLHTRLLNLAEAVEDKANEAGETDAQQERAEALNDVADYLRDAMGRIEEWANI